MPIRLLHTSAAAALAAAALLVLGGPAPAPAAYPGANGLVAFTSTQSGARHIFVSGPGGLRDLTAPAAPATETQPKFSPDGRSIAFVRATSGAQIFVMAA